MDLTFDEFRKKFPNLTKELEKNSMRLRINSVRSEVKDITQGTLTGYSPHVIDFLRRCDNIEEAMKIISFLEDRKEISHEYAKKIRFQLREKGLRSFGSKKECGYYFRQSGEDPR